MPRAEAAVNKEGNGSRLSGRIPELDGIRGLAILMVLVWHYVISIVPAHSGAWLSYLLFPFRLTWSGVDLFFVLSGFLIGGILLDAKLASNYFSVFYGRRFHRILPLYAVWLVIYAAGLSMVGSHSAPPLQALFNSRLPAWSYVTFSQNILMSWRRTFGAEWLGVTWSLAVEEQFYLVLPVLVRLLTLRTLLRVALGAVVAAPVIRLLLYFSGNVYYGPYTLLPSRADALGLGVAVAAGLREKRVWEWAESHLAGIYLACFGAGLSGAAFFAMGPPTWLSKSVGYSWLAVFYTLILVSAVVNPGRLVRVVFRNPMLVWLGTVSYCVYIVHQGVNALYHYWMFARDPRIDSWATVGVTVLSAATVMLLAQASWWAVELPLVRRGKSRFRYVFSARKPEAGLVSSREAEVPGLG